MGNPKHAALPSEDPVLRPLSAGEAPRTAYGRQLLAYVDGLPPDERAVLDELAELDRLHGDEPTPQK